MEDVISVKVKAEISDSIHPEPSNKRQRLNNGGSSSKFKGIRNFPRTETTVPQTMFQRQQLFEKVLSASDAGKSNRLALPKKNAIKYFPPVNGVKKEDGDGDGSSNNLNNVDLFFYDKFMRLWKFRYCHWICSQMLVFTRGWKLFSEANQLKANDVVSFYSCQDRVGNEIRSFYMIDVNNVVGNGAALVQTANIQVGHRNGEAWPNNDVKQEQQQTAAGADQKSVGFKLFGVHIIP